MDAEVGVYETLFNREDPNVVPEGEDFTVNLIRSRLRCSGTKLEPSLRDAHPVTDTNLSGWATSRSTRTALARSWCSTAPSCVAPMRGIGANPPPERCRMSRW